MSASTTTRKAPARRTTSRGFWVVVALLVLSIGLAVLMGPSAAAVLALVSLGAVLLWLMDTSPGLATVTLAGLLGAAWAGVLGLYDAVPWLDLLMHGLVTGLLAAVATQALLHHGILANTGRSRLVIIGCATTLGLALAGLWEILEWLGHTYVDGEIGVGYEDTISDIATGVLGAIVAGSLLPRTGARS